MHDIYTCPFCGNPKEIGEDKCQVCTSRHHKIAESYRKGQRLIVAAPEMLKLLRKTVDVLPCTDAHDLEPDLQDNIEALIAKIEKG